ncbi:MAG TPA: hypothetical protein VKG26_04230 [Bacteroidia bacterium]|nr:hypothetical protein [Bacteroidia bacterium]
MNGKILIALISAGLAFIIGCFFYTKNYHAKIKNSPKMYAYQTYWGPANAVLIIENLKYKNALISYYDSIEKNPSLNPIIELPLKTLPTSEPVYVVGYSKDSLLAEIVSYYDRGAHFGGDYLRGWVYVKTLHKTPLLKE